MSDNITIQPQVLLASALVGVALGAGIGLLMGRRIASKDAAEIDASVANLQKRAQRLIKELSHSVESANSAQG